MLLSRLRASRGGGEARGGRNESANPGERIRGYRVHAHKLLVQASSAHISNELRLVPSFQFSRRPLLRSAPRTRVYLSGLSDPENIEHQMLRWDVHDMARL